MSPAQPDRPEVEVTVGGAALEPLVEADVIEVDVHEEVGRHGRCTLLVQNWDADRRTVRHSDEGPFVPGADLGVSLGYHADLTPVFDGVVTSLTTHFPPGGRPVLRVEARSRSILLEHPPRSRQLAEVSDADVVSAIAADYDLTAEADTGVTREAVVSDRVSDWDFLRARAERLGWALYVRGSTLVMRAPAAPQDPPEFEYTRSLVELHLTDDLTRSIDSATGVAWDPGSLEAVESEQSAGAAGIDTGDRPDHAAAVGDAGWPLRSARDESPAETASDAADARAVGRQRDAALAHLHGRGVVLGDPTLRCDSWVTLTGVGTRMSGPHYLTAVRHRMSVQGYRTEVQVGRPPALVPHATGFDPRHRERGLALGIVESLDDPLKTLRVRVRMPWRADGGDGVWARLATLDAGDGYGTVVVPNVGAEVVVGFVDAEADAPVVLGQLYSGAAAPPEEVDPDANTLRVLVTPGGHRLTLDDGDAPRIALTSGKGHEVVVDDQEGAITLTHKDSGNSLVVSADGIAITAARGDITLKASTGTVGIDAMTFEGKASAPSKLESSASFDLTASGPLSLKGALVKIN
ncbi:MAG TPA: phage baseplate assembly protein V [Ornithinibacter sp.]|nr:phage baseplate assembly protein V [Ornithinibacter sp.]